MSTSPPLQHASSHRKASRPLTGKLAAVTRIDQIFQDLKAAGAKALMPYLTAGDPSLTATTALLPAMKQAGASIVEVGFPFTDPIADGPVIQAAMTRALDRGVTVRRVFDAVADAHANPHCQGLGIVGMVTYSIMFRLGVEAFCKDAANAGLHGLIVPDLPLESAQAVREAAGSQGLTLSMLVAPTTDDARAAKIAAACTGFVYVISRRGITGVHQGVCSSLEPRINLLRSATDLPLAVGFGIGSAQDVAAVVAHADAAIVGSALVDRLHSQAQATDDAAQWVEDAKTFVAGLAQGLTAH